MSYYHKKTIATIPNFRFQDTLKQNLDNNRSSKIKIQIYNFKSSPNMEIQNVTNPWQKKIKHQHFNSWCSICKNLVIATRVWIPCLEDMIVSIQRWHTHTQNTPKPSKTYNYFGLRAESWVRLLEKPSKKRVFLRRSMQVTQLCIPEWSGRRQLLRQ